MNYKKLESYQIKEIRGRVNYKLALSKDMRIHPVFHMSLFKPAPPGAPKAPHIEIDPINSDIEYKVEEILDYKYIRNRIKYLIK